MSKSQGIFEKAGTLSYQCMLGDGTPVVPDSIVSARLYSGSPTTAQREDTDNSDPGDAIESITSWSAGTETGEKLISYSAISDSEPNSTDEYEVYYWVISYKLESGGTTVNDIQPFLVWRAEGVISQYGVGEDEVYAVESKLDDWFGSQQVLDKIKLAEALVEVDLQADGKELRRVAKETAKELVQYKAVEICCQDASNETNDSWATKAERYARTYSQLFRKVPLGYDLDADDTIEPDEQAAQALGVMIR